MTNNINDLDKHHLSTKDEQQTIQSIYNINNFTIDVPMEQDLNCNSIIKSIINYYCGLSNLYLWQTLGCDISIDMDGERNDIDSSDP